MIINEGNLAVADAAVSDVVTPQEAASQEAPKPPEKPELDKYGRDAAERIVELASDDAEAINTEVREGKWQTYDGALHYVIARGVAEIKRTRDAAMKLMESKVLKSKRDQWSKLLQNNPALLANADVMQSMLKELGIAKEMK